MSAFTDHPFIKNNIISRIAALPKGASHDDVYLAIDPKQGHIPGVAAMRLGCGALDLDVMISAAVSPMHLAATINAIQPGQSLFGHGLMALSMWYDAITGLTWDTGNVVANSARLIAMDALKCASAELSEAARSDRWRNYETALATWEAEAAGDTEDQDEADDGFSPARDQAIVIDFRVRQVAVACSLLEEFPADEPIGRSVKDINEALLDSFGIDFRPDLQSAVASLPIHYCDLITGYFRLAIEMNDKSVHAASSAYRNQHIGAWVKAKSGVVVPVSSRTH